MEARKVVCSCANKEVREPDEKDGRERRDAVWQRRPTRKTDNSSVGSDSSSKSLVGWAEGNLVQKRCWSEYVC